MDYVLYHHGIKNMRWGIRRFQNKDGSLTPAGRKRYAKEAAELKERERAIKGKERTAAKVAKLDAKRAELDAREKALTNPKPKAPAKPKVPDAPKQKSIKDMSNDELNERIERLKLEQSYRELNPVKVSAGKKFVSTVGTEVLSPVLIDIGKKVASTVLAKAASAMLDTEIVPETGGNKNKKKKGDG